MNCKLSDIYHITHRVEHKLFLISHHHFTEFGTYMIAWLVRLFPVPLSNTHILSYATSHSAIYSKSVLSQRNIRYSCKSHTLSAYTHFSPYTNYPTKTTHELPQRSNALSKSRDSQVIVTTRPYWIKFLPYSVSQGSRASSYWPFLSFFLH